MNNKMKKFFNLFLSAMAMSGAALTTATMFASCGGEDDVEEVLNPQKPVEKAETGKYSLHFNSIHIDIWPDTNAGIEDQYAAYQKSITDALKVDLNKKYNWSDIEADKDRLTKVFDTFGDFEYKVKSLRNYIKYYGEDITFGALKDGSSYLDLKIGTKNITCIKDVPENATTQLYIEMSAYETVLTSAKEYCDKVRTLYTEALKEEFTGEYGTEVNGLTRKVSYYYNLANYTTDSLEVKNRVNKICQAVEIPALPDDVKKEAQALSPALPYVFKIWINKYDPKATYPVKSETEVFSLSICID